MSLSTTTTTTTTTTKNSHFEMIERVICFITKKTRFDISCNGDNLHEMQILFSWKNENNISKCRLLKTLPRMLSVMICTNKSRMGLCMSKPTITCTKRRISLHTLSLHISSLIRAFANRLYLLYGFNKTSCATSEDSGQSAQLHILIRAFADRIYLR